MNRDQYEQEKAWEEEQEHIASESAKAIADAEAQEQGDKEAQEKIAKGFISDDAMLSLLSLTEHGMTPTWLELDRVIKAFGYRKPLDRPELREKIEFQIAMAMNTAAEIEKSSPIASEWQDRMHKCRKDITDQILSLIIPKDKPRLLSPEQIKVIEKECYDDFIKTRKFGAYTAQNREEFLLDRSQVVFEHITQAQWDICVKHYGGKE